MEYADIKDRIAHIIRAKNLTAAEFAVRLGIQPSNVSHLLAGRNNPSLDFVKKLKETFPEYNLDWIIFGNGPMTLSEPFADSRRSQDEPMEEMPMQGRIEGLIPEPDQSKSMERLPLPTELYDGNVKRLIVVYEDDTFEILTRRG